MRFVLVLMAAMMLAVPVVSGQQADVFVLPEYLSSRADVPVPYDLTIANGPLASGYYLRLEGVNLGWSTNPDFYVELEPNEIKTYHLELTPTGAERGTYTYRFFVESENGRMSRTAEVRLTVLDPVSIVDMEAMYSEGSVNVEAVLDSSGTRDFTVDFVVIGPSGDEIARSSRELSGVSGMVSVSESIPLPSGLAAGEYRASISIKGRSIQGLYKAVAFDIPEIHQISQSARREQSTFYETVTVTVTNQGNVVEDYVVERPFPAMFTGFVTEPSNCRAEGFTTLCNYMISGLGPGESKELSYRVDYWPAFLPYAIIIIAVAGVFAGGFRRATRPTITKRHAKKSAKTHSITLEVKNPFYYNMQNAVLRDWVTPLASVMPASFDSLKPVVKRSDAGTELLWNLGNVKPREERIITYQIKPIVEGSGLRMPKASVRFTDRKGNTSKVSSKEIII